MNKKIEYAMHIAAWIIIFFTPLMYTGHNQMVNVERYLYLSVAPLTLVGMFYFNYLHVVPRYFFGSRRRRFFIVNIVTILILGLLLNQWMHHCRSLFDPQMDCHRMPPPMKPYMFILRDMFYMLMSCVVATTLRLAQRLHATENAQREAEQAKTEAELKTLRAQINPHFLLNTLNNIYALTAIDATRAQKAIDELSRILRHVLYDNDRAFIPISDEVKLMTDYVNLMRLRLASNVKVNFTPNIADDCTAYIAPMILISLVENAFKHGVSASAESFIDINITADNDVITCHIRNSNYPKPKSDHSGHGIGLQQVGKRLEIMYHGQYKWEKWADDKEYNSKIILYDTKLCNH